MTRVHLLGSTCLRDARGGLVRGPAAQRHRLALLALLAASRGGVLTRDKLIGFLWPERGEASARHSLSVSLHVLRKALGEDAFVTGGDELALNPEAARMEVDVCAFLAAFEREAWGEAAAHYAGPFLDGFFLPGSPEFGPWLDGAREALEGRYADALEHLAADAAARGDPLGTAQAWHRLATLRPDNSRLAARLVEALDASGDRAGAVRYAAAHEALLKREYGVSPSAELHALVSRLRTPAPVAPLPEAPAPGAAPQPAPVARPRAPHRGPDRPSPLSVREQGPAPPHGPPHGDPREGRRPATLPSPALASRRARVRLTAMAGLLVLASGLAWALAPRGWAARGPGGPAPSAVETIRVGPFQTAPADTDDTGLAVATLLATNLSQLDAVRVVALRGGAGPARGEETVLTGNVLRAGPTLRIQALLHRRGSTLALHVDGPADSLLALVDRLTVAVVREVWRAHTPPPALRIDAITTTSVEAAQAYIRGEAFLRASKWDRAIGAFEAAVVLDSTFALAHFRLSESHSWRAGLVSSGTERALDAATRHAHRLPPRERALLAIRRLHREGDVRVVDTVAVAWQRFPNDADLHYLRADARYHTSMVLGGERHSLYGLFDSAIALSRHHVPWYLHPLDLSLRFGDHDRFAHYLGGLLSASADPGVEALWEAAGAVRWAPPDAALARYAAAIRAERPGHFGPLTKALLLATYEADRPRPDLFLRGLGAPEGSRPVLMRRQSGPAVLAQALVGLGRIEAAQPFREAVLASADRSGALHAYALPALVGLAPPESVPARLLSPDVLPSPAERLYYQGLLAIRRPALPSARRLLHAAQLADTSGERVYARGLARAGLGWADVVAGDTLRGLAEMEAGLRAAGYGDKALGAGQALRLHLLRLQAARPETRDTALARLRWQRAHTPAVLYPLLTRWLGDALALAGEEAEARRLHAQADALWAGADPSFRQALRVHAR